jgi:hypothetical protein
MPVKTAKIEIEKKEEEEKHEKLEPKFAVARLTSDMISDFGILFKYLCYAIFTYGLFSILQDVGVMG